MGTPCVIGIATSPTANYQYITVHYDGYIEDAGVLLLVFYNTEERVRNLISLGHLSALGPTIGTKFDFDDNSEYYKRARVQCIAYHRDRGNNLLVGTTSSLKKFQHEEFTYIWRDGQWWYYRYGGHRKLLSEVITQDQLNRTCAYMKLRLPEYKDSPLYSVLEEQIRIFNNYRINRLNESDSDKSYYIFKYSPDTQRFSISELDVYENEMLDVVQFIPFMNEFSMYASTNDPAKWTIFNTQVYHILNSDIDALQRSVGIAKCRLQSFNSAVENLSKEKNNGN